MDEFDHTRLSRFTPRWPRPALRTGDLNLEFCEQVGEYDVWLTPTFVIFLRPKNRGEPFASIEEYQHAKLRFPRIAEKMQAMRVMLFGVTGDD